MAVFSTGCRLRLRSVLAACYVIHGQYMLRIVLYSSYSYSVCLVSGGVNNTYRIDSIQNTEYGIRGLTLVLRVQDRPYWERVWSVPIHNTEYDTEYGPAPNCTERSPSQAGTVRFGTGFVRGTLYSYSVFCIGVDSTLSQSRFGAASVFCIRIPYSVLGHSPSFGTGSVLCIRILYSYSVSRDWRFLYRHSHRSTD